MVCQCPLFDWIFMCRGSPREWHHGALPGHISATHASQQGRANGFNTEARRHRDTENCILDRIYRINRMGCPLSTFSTFSTRLILCVLQGQVGQLGRVGQVGQLGRPLHSVFSARLNPQMAAVSRLRPANRARVACAAPEKKPQIKFFGRFPDCTKIADFPRFLYVMKIFFVN